MAEPTLKIQPPGDFDPEAHYYPRVPNAALHPLVRAFLALGNERLAARYCHLHPEADRDAVHEILATVPKHFRWSGADLFHVTNEQGVRANVVLETNSCPSGQKSMPLRDEDDLGGYRRLIEKSFLPHLRRQRNLPKGALAVLCDKNRMETTGYARTLAEVADETVYWVDFKGPDWQERARWDNGVLHVLDGEDWVPIRAAFRYVTQQPWGKLPVYTRTWLYNPVLVCLAGGRNKLLAAKAYDFFNADMSGRGLRIRVPETIWDVSLHEVPLWVERMGGVAVVKNPYSNAGQGVFTITSPRELEAFQQVEHRYDSFIVQALIGNKKWSSQTREGRLYHVGMVPTTKGHIYVADFRMMIGSGPEGFFPVAMYARRARAPLVDTIEEGSDSWDMLGTNLSVRTGDGFSTEPRRLLMMDQRDFNRMGLGLDDLTEGYLQTCMSTIAIDRMAQQLRRTKGGLKRRLFKSLVPDDVLLSELHE